MADIVTGHKIAPLVAGISGFPKMQGAALRNLLLPATV